MAKKTYFSIGQMSKLCNISKKQLRYYDDNGILSPKFKSPHNNYRYYSEDQIEEILLLQELKNLGFTLKDITIMLEERSLFSLRKELENRVYKLREELNLAQSRYNSAIDALLRVRNGLDYIHIPQQSTGKIELVDFAERTVLFTRYRSFWGAENLFISRRAELLKLAAENNLSIYGSNMAIFHSNYLNQFSNKEEDLYGDLEVCISVSACPHNLTFCRKLGPFKAVFGIFTGHYKNLFEPYSQLQCWASERKIELSGASLEEYLVSATMTGNHEDYVTAIYLPLSGYEV